MLNKLFAITLMIIATYESTLCYEYYIETASVPQVNTIQIGVFSNSSYGLTENIAANFNSLLLPLSPSIDFKFKFVEAGKLSFSPLIGLQYPVLMLNIMRGEGPGGIISPEFSIPQMIALRAGGIAAYEFEEGLLLSAKLTAEICLKEYVLNEGTTVDLPVLAPELAVYYRDVGIYLAIAGEYLLTNSFNLFASNKSYFFPFTLSPAERQYHFADKQSFFNESMLGLTWKTGAKSKLVIAGMLCYGNYSFGNAFHLLPFADFQLYIN